MAEEKDDELVLVREMGCTEADLARWLPGATRHAAIRTIDIENGKRFCIETGSGTIEMTSMPAAPRRIAGIVLPVLQVRFRFIGMTQKQRDEFLTYFDHYTRRGGG